MRRRIDGLAARDHDLLVVGGGALGAMVAWDASLRGLEVALVEKDDFASGASSNSLKIVHGGLRYLQSLDVRRARESIRERKAWLEIAPHLVEPLPVLVGTRDRLTRGRLALGAGMALADALGWDRNRSVAPERRLPRGRLLSRRECLRLAPELEAPDLTGGALFHDAQMYSSERLVLEAVEAAARRGACVANHARLTGALRSADGELLGGRVSDELSGGAVDVRARMVVNAAGAASGRVADLLTDRSSPELPEYSLAVNLVVDVPAPEVAYGLPTGNGADDGRELFVVPWRGRTLVGTGHYELPRPAGEGAGLPNREPYVSRFLDEVNAAFDGREISEDQLLRWHAGRLPVRGGGGPPLDRLLRRRRIVDHAADGTPRALTGVSVKFTTARLLAEEVVDGVCERLGAGSGGCATAETPLPGAASGPPEAVRGRARRELGGELSEDSIEHLVRSYGGEFGRVAAHASWMEDWDRSVVADSPAIRAQLAHGVVAEMGRRPEDLLCRRTEVGALGLCDAAAERTARDVLSRAERRLADAGGEPTGAAGAGAEPG